MDGSRADLYKTVFETWRFQVNSYWQRTSYFAAFESAALIGDWTLLQGQKPHVYSARFGAILGIVLTVFWLLNNQKTHLYAKYWWEALAQMEHRDPQIDFVRNYEGRRERLRRRLGRFERFAPVHYYIQVQVVPFLFGLVWFWLLFFHRH